jgi:trk system potassium uptake protein TrkA
MKIVVAGTGTLGFTVARKFSEERHDVVLVGEDEDALRRAQDVMDVGAVAGKASTPSVLLQAGLRSADILVAVTGSDETNIVACLIAETVSERIARVARIHDPAYLGEKGIIDKSSLSIDLVISPEEEVARAVSALAATPGASDVLEFADGQVRVFGVEVGRGSPMAGKPIRDLRRRPDEKLLVAGVYRDELVSAPSGDTRVAPGDTLFFVSDKPSVRRVLARMGKRWTRTRNVIIAGGGWEGVSIARRLSADGIHTKLIERDPILCQRLSQMLGDTLILNGDCMDEALLADEGVRRAELFVAALGNETENILAALLAKRFGARRVAALVNRPEYMPCASTIGVDVVVSPLLAALNPILQLARPGRVLAVRTLRENLVEGIEFVAVEESGIVGLPLAMLRMPHGSLVGAIVRDGEVIVPDGSSVVRPGDSVVLFARPDLIPRLQRLMAPA